MKYFVDICFNIRVVIGEVGGTATLLFLTAYGLYKAWQEFVVKPLKGTKQSL